MRHIWTGAAVAICAASTMRAQDLDEPRLLAPSEISASFNGPSSAGNGNASALIRELRAPALTFKAAAFAPHGSEEVGAFAAEPAPAMPEPKLVFGARDDYRWQLGLGVSLVRFRSSRFYATGVGTSTSLAYFTNEWFAIQGEVTTAFAPTIYQDDHVKYVSYGAGPMIALRRRKIEPWMHALMGGVHLLPQTVGSSKSSFGAQVGAGVDYRFYPHLSARLELDWVRSHLFSQWQDSVQTALELVLHF